MYISSFFSDDRQHTIRNVTVQQCYRCKEEAYEVC
jgi:hypothetical protein